MRLKTLSILGILGLAGLQSSAIGANVDFGGTVSAQACTIVVLNDGTLAQNVNATVISSQQPGATSGLVRVTNNGFARVSAFQNDIVWNAPAADTTYTNRVAFLSSVSVAGDGTSHPQVFGDSGFNLSNGSGISDVTVDVEGRKYFGNFSTADQYSATVTVVCS